MWSWLALGADGAEKRRRERPHRPRCLPEAVVSLGPDGRLVYLCAVRRAEVVDVVIAVAAKLQHGMVAGDGRVLGHQVVEFRPAHKKTRARKGACEPVGWERTAGEGEAERTRRPGATWERRKDVGEPSGTHWSFPLKSKRPTIRPCLRTWGRGRALQVRRHASGMETRGAAQEKQEQARDRKRRAATIAGPFAFSSIHARSSRWAPTHCARVCVLIQCLSSTRHTLSVQRPSSLFSLSLSFLSFPPHPLPAVPRGHSPWAAARPTRAPCSPGRWPAAWGARS